MMCNGSLFSVQKEASKVRNRFFLILGLGLFSLFGSSRAIIGGSNLAGSGALGALVLAFVAAQGWDKMEKVRGYYSRTSDNIHCFVYRNWYFVHSSLFGNFLSPYFLA